MVGVYPLVSSYLFGSPVTRLRFSPHGVWSYARPRPKLTKQLRLHDITQITISLVIFSSTESVSDCFV